MIKKIEVRKKKGAVPWFLQRLSAVYLIFGMILHVVNNYYGNSIRFYEVSERLGHIFWVLFDSSLLIVVIYHALNGLRNIVYDYDVKENTKVFVTWSLSILGVFLTIIGVWILVAFIHP